MSDSYIQINLKISDGSKLATFLNGDEHTQKIALVDATGVSHDAANPLQVAVVGGITPGDDPGNLGKSVGGTAGGTDVGVAPLYRYVATPAAHGAADGTYLVPQLDANGYVRMTGTVTVSNGVPGVADDTASNFTVGTTQGLAIMGLADETASDACAEDRAGVVRMTLDRHLRTVAVEETGFIKSLGVNLTVKYASIAASASGNNTLVAAAGAGKKIRVLAATLSFNGSVNAKFQSGAGGTDLTGLTYGVVNAGFVLPYNPHGWFETAANTLLNLNLSAAVAVGGMLTYIEVT